MKKLAINKEDIDKHNKLFTEGLKAFKRGLWEYSDVSPGDKEKYLQGVLEPKIARLLLTMPRPPQYPSSPLTVDWRTKGLVAPVESQGRCCSCWAFSAKGVIEAALRRVGVNDPLSPQQLVDCSKTNCYGCRGGWPIYALDYFKANGTSSRVSYPHTMSQGNCSYTKTMSLPNVLNHTYNVNTNGNETWLRDIVASAGPVSIVMRVEESFYSYRSGVYFEPSCGQTINHAMLLVGFVTDPFGGDFWIIKSDSWGEKGYVRMTRNKENMCDIASRAVYAT